MPLRFILTLTLIGCGGGSGTDTSDTARTGGSAVGGGCLDTPRVLAQDEVSPLGFSAQEILAATSSPYATAGAYPDTGVAVNVAMTVASRAGDIVFHDLEQNPDASTDMYWYCDDYVVIPVSVTFSSDDGAFDEVADGALSVASPDLIGVAAPLDYAALNGTFDVTTQLDPAEWDAVELSVASQLVPSFAGSVDVFAERVLGEVAEATMGRALEWPPAGYDPSR